MAKPSTSRGGAAQQTAGDAPGSIPQGRNKAYWKTEDVKLDNLIFSITPDAAVRLQKLKECRRR
ncbi:hypothetical protein [Pseudomonas sp. NPDC087615]|uniref:hypothetical protein n=1 Tax=Pseudomonas sp. NPDC087615 TaxID=3364443 RepID=UPI0037FB9BAA